MGVINQILTNKPNPCLFVNVGGILDKLLQGSKMPKLYRAIKYDTEKNKRTITEVVRKLNINTIVIETSTAKEYSENVIRELITLSTRDNGV